MALPPWPSLAKPIKILVIFVIFCFLYTTLFHTKTMQILQIKQATPPPSSPLSEAEKLYQEVRILCMVITAPKTHDTRAVHILRTWGRHCNRLVFISSDEHGELEPIVVNVKEGRDNVWVKIQKGLGLVYKYYAHEMDWLLKIEDDTFVILENLRHFLSRYSPSSTIYFGLKTMPSRKLATNAGYVLSKEAVRRFLSPKVYPPQEHKQDEEQTQMERWLQSVGVSPGNSNLQDGGTFFSYPAFKPKNITELVEQKANSSVPWWSLEKNTQRPSKHAIAFHNVESSVMYNLEYLIHHMRLFGKTRRI